LRPWQCVFYFDFLSNENSSTTDTNTTDTVAIQKGQAIFSQQCAACHNFRQDGIGPQLGGITATVSSEWIENFIKDPKGDD
jgi:mono/diheme cytochrome c family protein